jgi:hypothetical protein
MTFDRITSEIAAEILRAEKKHGGFPVDQIHCAVIVAEESGELVQAAIDHTYSSQCPDRLREEAIQTAAMCYRFLMNPALPSETYFDRQGGE